MTSCTSRLTRCCWLGRKRIGTKMPLTAYCSRRCNDCTNIIQTLWMMPGSTAYTMWKRMAISLPCQRLHQPHHCDIIIYHPHTCIATVTMCYIQWNNKLQHSHAFNVQHSTMISCFFYLFFILYCICTCPILLSLSPDCMQVNFSRIKPSIIVRPHQIDYLFLGSGGSLFVKFSKKI